MQSVVQLCAWVTFYLFLCFPRLCTSSIGRRAQHCCVVSQIHKRAKLDFAPGSKMEMGPFLRILPSLTKLSDVSGARQLHEPEHPVKPNAVPKTLDQTCPGMKIKLRLFLGRVH